MMRLLLTFAFLTILVSQAWAEKGNKPNPTEEVVVSPPIDVISKIISSVYWGDAVLKPNIIPPEVADRLRVLDERERLRMETIFHNLQGSVSEEDYKRGYRDGQIAAMVGLLYSTGTIPDRELTSIPENIADVRKKGKHYDYAEPLRVSRIRSLVTLLFLSNLKEQRPVNPSEMIISISK